MKYQKEVIFLKRSSDPELWEFFDYGTTERSLIDDWLDEQPEGVQDIFEAVFKSNRKIADPKNWQDSRKMEGKLAKEGIWEYRIQYANVQYRLLGVFGPHKKQAVFLIGCTHKMKIYCPQDCLKTAIKRARAVRRKEATLHERKIQENI